jgi:hypothetical protein
VVRSLAPDRESWIHDQILQPNGALSVDPQAIAVIDAVVEVG